MFWMDIKYHAYELGEIGRRYGSGDREDPAYPDKGCNLAPSCLHYPFAFCQYDWSDRKRKQLAALPRIRVAG